MKKIILIIITMLACLLNFPAQAATCDVWGNKDFTVTFNVVGPASNSYVYLEHSGRHPREVLWYNGYEYGNANYYFDEPNLLAGQPYNIRLEHQVSHNSGTLKYYRKFAGESDWQLISTINNVNLKNGKLSLYEQGSPSGLDCDGSLPAPIEPELPSNICQYFPEPIQGMKGYSENTLNVPNKSARVLGWSEDYKSFYTVTNKEDLFYYSSNAQQPNKAQYILAGFDKANVDDARDRLYRSPICGSDTGCDVGNNDGHLEARKASEPTGVPTDFGDHSLSLEAHNIGYKCDNTSLCSATRYSLNGKSGIEIKIEKNLDRLWVSQNNSPFDQIKVILPDGTNVRNFRAEAGPRDDLRIVIPQDSTVTFERWEHVGHTKYSFYNNSRINVSGNSVVFSNPIDVTTNYYATIYAPNASVNFQTKSKQFYGFILADTVNFNNPITVHGSVTARHLTMKKNVVIQKPDYSCPVEPPVQQCNLLPMETFSSSNVDNWSVIGYDSSIKPQVVNGRFRLNGNRARQATASAYNYLFPSDENYLEVEFDHFAYGGGYNGADGVALVISDANVPPQTGAFGGPLGYGMKLHKNHSGEVSHDVEGFAGGWLGIGIDEYGNFYREGGENLASHGSANSVGVRGAGIKDNNGKWLKGYKYIKGKQFNQPLDNRSSTPHRYKVILNSRNSGAITLSVQRKVGVNGQWHTVISNFDVLTEGNFNYTPENFRISVTASTGALTNTHEMDNFQVCADKYQKITEGIHHFEFDYAGTGSICQASEVTLRACMDASCSKTYPSSVLSSNPGATVDPVTVSLLPQSDSLVAWEGGDRVTFSDSVSLKLQAFQSGSAKLGIARSSVLQFGFDRAKCRIAGGPLSEQNCNIVFNSAALGVTVPDKVAGKPFFNTKGQAQYSNQRSPYLEFCSSPSQQGGDGENRDVQLSIERIEPTSNAVSVPAYVSFKKRDGSFSNEVTVGTNTVEVADVYFNKQGKAYFNLKYPEAGKVALKAKIKDEKDSLGQNSFVSFPAYLKLTVDGGLCGSGSCSQKLVAAGEEFTMKVTAYQFGDDKKPAQNYQQSGLTISHKVSYPQFDSAIPGTLGTTTYDHINLTNGTGSVKQTVSEVGAFDFTITPPETYLGSKAFTITPAEENIGRFYPKYFRVDEAKGNQWAYPHKENFAYMGQSFGVEEFYVEALNADKGALTNYAFFSSGLQAKFGLKDTSSYQPRFILNKTYTGAWVNNGAAYVTSRSLGKFTGSTTDGLELLKGSGSSYPDGPLNFNENAKDTAISIKSADDNKDPVSIDGSEGLLPTQPDIRFGRVDLDDVGGNQGSTLRMPLRVEYWNGSRFIANPNDSQTDVTGVKAKQEHIWPKGDNAKPKDVTLGAGGEVASGHSRSVTAKEAEPYRQQTRVWLNLEGGGNSLPWLKYDWDKDGSEENPSSVVTFGIHRGNDRVIYRGEPGLTGQ
ncbi:TPA: MSHA biogenesis protein MshQ [Vibrio harveyi]|nr:MSHA biogenesis protein MshQ [Vibrio harveyi]HEQ3597949.1 MSHA biogenesis protein MshQ [Vibrio harveyi]HEQ3610335.1 MSHA biogenesis protein MshQ [Vibrio harveyi]